jgi:glutamyl-tRNA synthetase
VVRVRYAGAPSGDLHLGNIRTALFNWMFARHTGGTFVWRVEDTDPERAKPELIERGMETFRWLGMDWDEGPEVGGPHEPYRQSQRSSYYAQIVEQLLASGAIYRCYCTRDDLLARGVKTGYDRHCRTRTDQPDAPFALRFAVPEQDVIIDDLLLGEVRRPWTDIQDFVVQRTTGEATFVLANTADDVAMEITHVMRGGDLLPAASQNALLFDALGVKRPAYIHVPLILGPDKSRLGARHGAVGTLAYRDAGYLPEALSNYLSLLGWAPGTGEEIMSVEQRIELFSLEGLQTSNAVFDLAKLDWMNQEYIKTLPRPELESRILALDPSIPSDVLKQVLDHELIQTRITTLAQVPDDIRYLYEPPELDESAAAKFLGTGEANTVLSAVSDKLEALEPWSVDGIREAVQGTIEEHGIHRRKGPKPIFVAIAGTDRALPLFESIYIVGQHEAVSRLRAATSTS